MNWQVSAPKRKSPKGCRGRLWPSLCNIGSWRMQNVLQSGMAVCRMDVAKMKDMYVAPKVLTGLDARRRRIVSQAGKLAIRQRNGLVKFTNYQQKKIVVLTPLTAERADVAKAP